MASGTFDPSWFADNAFDEDDVRNLASAFARAGNAAFQMRPSIRPAVVRVRAGQNFRFNASSIWYPNAPTPDLLTAFRAPRPAPISSEGSGLRSGQTSSKSASTTENVEPIITSVPTEGRGRR